MSSSDKFIFKEPLIEGVIKSRPNRFIMCVETGGEIKKCHCPTTGRIGTILFSDIPCLLSKATSKNRRTSHTVEAISIDNQKTWIGINQTAINGYVEHFLKANKLADIAPGGLRILREQTIGSSRLDFYVGNSFIEVKMPLMFLPTDPAAKNVEQSRFKRLLQDKRFSERARRNCCKVCSVLPVHEELSNDFDKANFEKNPSGSGLFNSFDRLIKHVTELTNSLKNNERAILLLCFVFDAPRFVPPTPNKYNTEIVNAVARATAMGVETWQLNLSIDKFGVDLIKYAKLSPLIN